MRARARAGFVATEVGLWASVYLAYFAVRGLTIDSGRLALEHARDLIALERALGVFHEARVQDALGPLEQALSVYYLAGFGPVIALTLVVLAVTRADAYRELRTALLLSIGLATAVFVVFSAAPPRLVPELGIADSVGLAGGHDTGSFAGIRFNPYAAMPSMHVGWSLLVGIAGVRAARPRAVRVAFAAHPAVMAVAVTATGNHYFLDSLAGAAVALTGLALARRLPRPVSRPAARLRPRTA
ncbi:MAG: phosphatase PAP2 family protein [Thermoleophilia bacterium]|nr:phosphatase PAP2 family protein [Thermoleophilia bacterium]